MKATFSTVCSGILFAACFFLLNGCSASNGRVNFPRHFLLQGERQAPASAVSGKGVLRIRPFRVSSPFAGDQLVYQTGDSAFEADYYKRFLVPPGPMITDQTQKWLSQSGLFSSVVDAGSNADSDYTLEGWIFALHGDFRENDIKAVLEIQAVLLQEASGDRKILLDRTYLMKAPVASRQVSDLIAGMNDCLRQFLSLLEADMAEVFSKK
ncbi:MAG: membrane integrity-associated transporter subunit PqiC [Sedimentisphaerales bacterium]|nr:membrane integrity-associated transporter subunit PqiC [Sedimentisphaerales bacterium]